MLIYLTSSFLNNDLEAVVKSLNLVPTPITKSAFSAIELAAKLPVTPTPPKFKEKLPLQALFPA
jgi:hypothetical protein